MQRLIALLLCCGAGLLPQAAGADEVLVLMSPGDNAV